jgi:colanic acid biosynthesis protein WcaH
MIKPPIPELLYDEILRSMPIACVDIAIVCNGRILLVLRKEPPAKGQWWFPGGRVFKGETMKQTAQRKSAEEVGLICHVGPILHTGETIFPDGPRAIAVHTINSCFLLYPVGGFSNLEVRLDENHLEYKWVGSIPEGLHPYVVKCLRKAGLD